MIGFPHLSSRFLLLFLLAIFTGCRTSDLPQFRREYSATLMGMPWRIVLYAPNSEDANAAAAAAFQRVADLNQILSDYEPDSELSRLSRSAGSGRSVPLSPELASVLIEAARISAASEGSFDVTVGPLVDLWKRARRQRVLPEPARLEAALTASGWTHVVLSHTGSGQTTALLRRLGMRLDLGGIAKGYAIDEATRVLRARGIRCSLVSGGGDLFAAGSPPGESGWKIQVGRLDISNAPTERTVWLRDRALVTSGDLFQRVEIKGVRYSHIIDPRTGQALTNHSQVTLIGNQTMTTDALSKVISVLGPSRAPSLARKFNVAFLLFQAPKGQVVTLESPHWYFYEKH
ncbi:MAG: FAD:protein FMN transferase [Pedosphaera sp.]|nr:FAD:protein FMN transferase [Pedosphaera sp.]